MDDIFGDDDDTSLNDLSDLLSPLNAEVIEKELSELTAPNGFQELTVAELVQAIGSPCLGVTPVKYASLADSGIADTTDVSNCANLSQVNQSVNKPFEQTPPRLSYLKDVTASFADIRQQPSILAKSSTSKRRNVFGASGAGNQNVSLGFGSDFETPPRKKMRSDFLFATPLSPMNRVLNSTVDQFKALPFSPTQVKLFLLTWLPFLNFLLSFVLSSFSILLPSPRHQSRCRFSAAPK